MPACWSPSPTARSQSLGCRWVTQRSHRRLQTLGFRVASRQLKSKRANLQMTRVSDLFFFKCLFIYFERERESGRPKEREREGKFPSRFSAVSVEPHAGLNLMNLSRSRELDAQPNVPPRRPTGVSSLKDAPACGTQSVCAVSDSGAGRRGESSFHLALALRILHIANTWELLTTSH